MDEQAGTSEGFVARCASAITARTPLPAECTPSSAASDAHTATVTV
jgi:hypothetical protein